MTSLLFTMPFDMAMQMLSNSWLSMEQVNQDFNLCLVMCAAVVYPIYYKLLAILLYYLKIFNNSCDCTGAKIRTHYPWCQSFFFLSLFLSFIKQCARVILGISRMDLWSQGMQSACINYSRPSRVVKTANEKLFAKLKRYF